MFSPYLPTLTLSVGVGSTFKSVCLSVCLFVCRSITQKRKIPEFLQIFRILRYSLEFTALRILKTDITNSYTKVLS